MALKYVLNQAGLKMGLQPSDATQRTVLLRFANEAMSELYDQADMDGVLMEQLFRVNGDQSIALPMSVGPIRAMREYSTHVPWHMYDMRPRYNQFNWKDRWRSWRLKGVGALNNAVVNQAPNIIVVHDVETPNIIITLGGPTSYAQFASETITVTQTQTPCAIAFLDIVSFKKDRVNNFDVHLMDTDGNELSLLHNNALEARYRVVDVSLYPWSNTDTGPTDHYMEILFKKALPWMQNDDDEFPAQGYDNIIVNKMLQLWAEESEKGDLAVAFDAKATRSLARKHEDQHRGAEKVVALSENPHDTLLPRNRPVGPSRYMGQVYY